MDVGCTEGGGFNDETSDYIRNPTLENFLRLRRADPDCEIEVSVVGGIDQLFFMEKELRHYGFDPEFVASTMDADQAAISELSLQIAEKLVAAQELEKGGETGFSFCAKIPGAAIWSHGRS